MSQRRHSRYVKIPMSAIALSLMITLLLSANSLLAQDGTEPAATVEVVTEAPVSEPLSTEAPTEVPATEQPTEIPTEAATTAPLPTEAPTEAPTQAETVATEVVTVEATPEVTVTTPAASALPSFSFFNGTEFENTVGTPLLFQVSISDDTGPVRVQVTAANGTVSATSTEPTAAPFNTLVDVTYTAADSFSGSDTITLVALDGEGQTVTATVSVTVVAQAATAEPTEMPVATKEMLITYNPAASEDVIQQMLTELGAVELSRIPQIGAMRVLLPEVMPSASNSAQTPMMTLQSSGTGSQAGVKAIEENTDLELFAFPATAPTDPRFNLQWGLSEGPGGIFAQRAWSIALTRGTGVIVAVIDGGVDLQHPDMALQYVPGWDFVNDDNNPDNRQDIPNGDGTFTTIYDNAHGTMVAGIIAAKTNNAIGTSGLAFGAKIMPLKACNTAIEKPTCGLYHVAGAIVHAVDKGAKVINLSLGSTQQSSTIEAAINYALSRNVVVVAAAGNISLGNPQPADDIPDNTLVYPAAYPGVISVSAHDINGVRAIDSMSNNMVDISAPGVDIESLMPIELGSYGADSGTSMASAYVSGVAALIIGQKVAITPSTVMDALICGAQDAGDAGRDNVYGYGRMQADYSLNWKGNSSGCAVTLPNDSFTTPTVMAVAPFTSILPIDSRTVSAHPSDPTFICDGVTPSQTLWYSFRPSVSGNYQISMLGSSYNTVVGVFQGTAGQMNRIGCSSNAQSTLSLQALQTYYIVVGTNGAPVNGQVLQLRLNAALPANNVLYQENALNISYSGMWMRGLVTGASLLYTQQTTDVNASAAFSFRGTSFDYYRTVGPSQGRVLIYINNDPTPIVVDNRGAVTKANQKVNPDPTLRDIVIPNANTGQWNTVRIVRDTTVPGVIDIDAIKTFDFDNSVLATTITTKVDDRALNLRYTNGDTGAWESVKAAGTYLGTLKQTNDPTAFVTFRTSGSAITIFRMTGPTGFAPMQVTIDNGTPITIDNTAAGTPIVRPYTIDGLVAMPHVVKIQKIGTAVDGLIIQLDAIQSLTMVNMLAATTYDDRAVTALAYRGSWTDTAAVAGAVGLTTRTLNANSEVSFKFAGNDLCVGYKQNAGNLDVHIDGLYFTTISIPSSVPGFAKWCLDLNAKKLLVDGTHYARLVVPGGSTFTLDYVRSQRYATLTPTRALVPETNLSFRYSAPTDWVTQTTLGKSAGGYLPQGGSIKTTSTDNTSVSFYMSGTGFILYTGVGPIGCMEIKIDNVVWDASPHPAYTGLDLNDPATTRYTPLGYGFTGLTPGVHRIDLIADKDCSSIGDPLAASLNFYFDGIRVFP